MGLKNLQSLRYGKNLSNSLVSKKTEKKMELGLVSTPYDDKLSGGESHYNLCVSKTAGSIILGVANGEHEGNIVSLTPKDSAQIFPMVTDVPSDVMFMASTTTPFMESGRKYRLRFNGTQANLGYTLYDNNLVSIEVVDMTTTGDVVKPKKKQQIKPVTLIDGRVLSREGTMRALVVWLNTLNNRHAPNYGVTKLVWCKENTRQGGAMQRTFFSMNLETKHQKPCANATAAITLMQNLTGHDFYADMKQRSHMFELGNVSDQPAIPVAE